MHIHSVSLLFFITFRGHLPASFVRNFVFHPTICCRRLPFTSPPTCLVDNRCLFEKGPDSCQPALPMYTHLVDVHPLDRRTSLKSQHTYPVYIHPPRLGTSPSSMHTYYVEAQTPRRCTPTSSTQAVWFVTKPLYPCTIAFLLEKILSFSENVPYFKLRHTSQPVCQLRICLSENVRLRCTASFS